MVKQGNDRYAAGTLFSLEGKTVLLTGASGFLGRTMVRALLDNGAAVLMLGASERVAAQVPALAGEYGPGRIAAYRVDLYDLPAAETALSLIDREHPVIDVIVNNAHELGSRTGFNVPEGHLENATFDGWMRNLTGGVYWAALTTQKIGAGMKSRGKGSIVNISTMYAVVAPSPHLYEGTRFINPPGYGAAKAALVAFTRYTASFWGPYGVRANAILPGPFSNVEEGAENSVSAADPFLDRLRSRTVLGRVGAPGELVGALLYLASDASTFTTGQALVVDGGWTIV
ncbi:MAG: SDR family oxidoreductase [Acidobacteriia bacterium]|nr:SDR family oxidoreductase [Terriglobia bacterium]